MDVIKLKESGFRIKGKNATVNINSEVISIGDKDDVAYEITSAGEYEIKGVSVIGIQVDKGIKAFRLNIDDVNFCFPGNLSHKLTDSQTEALDGVDILFAPAIVPDLVSQIEPLVVIPYGSSDTVAKYLKDTGRDGLAPIPKLVISKDKLPADLQVILLE